MADKITWSNERRKLSELIPWDINPAQINKKQAERLEESLELFGQIQTLAISPTNEIYDGHQRQLVWGASQKYGGDYEVDVRVASRELTEQERKKLIIYLRKGAVGEFDFDILANNFEVDELLDWGFDAKELDLTLWDKDEPLDDPGAQINRAEELREKWGVELGQLWQLGEHRLICGDCTEMDKDYSLPLFTDPPYGVDYEPLHGVGSAPQSATTGMANDDGLLDLSWLLNYERRMVWGFPYIYDPNATGWIVWDKQPGKDGRDIVTPIEIASTTMRKGFEKVTCMWIGFYRAAGEDRMPHPTQKPVQVIEPFIEKWTKPGEVVYDPFLGSGTTLIACERLNRKCRAVEISPAYCAVARLAKSQYY